MDRDSGRKIAEPIRTRLIRHVVQRRILRIVLGLIVVVASAPSDFVASAPPEKRTSPKSSETKIFSEPNFPFRPLDRRPARSGIEEFGVSPVIQTAYWIPYVDSNSDQLILASDSDDVPPSPTYESPIESKFWHEDESLPDESDLPPSPSVEATPAPIHRGPVALREFHRDGFVRRPFSNSAAPLIKPFAGLCRRCPPNVK